MSAPQTIKIDSVEYVRADSVTATPSGNKRIVVLQRGWVVIGDQTVAENGDYVLTNAAVIRNWGTTKGLGELVNGPTSKTVIDKVGTITYAPLTAVLTVIVDSSKW